MPRKCCVPECKSNYDSTKEYVTVFKFPSDSDERETWKKCVYSYCIPRKNWSPTKSSAVVCRKHFRPCDMILSDTITDANGIQCELPRKNPVLKSNAYPCLFSERSAVCLPIPVVPQSQKGLEKSVAEIVRTVIAEMKDINPLPLQGHCDTWLKLPDSASGDGPASTSSSTSDLRQTLAPGQITGMYCCRGCSAVFPHHNMLFKHFMKKHYGESSIKIRASAELFAKHCDKSVKKEDCHDGMTDDTNNEGKRTHSHTVTKSHNLDVCHTGYVNVSQLQVNKHEQKRCTSAESVAKLTDISSQKLIHENSDKLTDDKLHSGYGNSNETLQETISANEIKSEVCVMDECHIVDDQKTIHIHTVEKRCKSELCDAEFDQFSQLKAYITKHMSAKPYHCDVCDARFTVEYSLLIHMRKHTGEKPYVCEYCDASFVNRPQLKFHRTSHTGKTPYKCDVCGSGFNQANSLQAHMVKHTGVKPFHCEVCGVGFTFKSYMQTHMRKHTGEKPCVCDDCGARFANRRQLKVHRISHTGEKPYKCDICGSGFNQAFSLQLHKRKHAGKQPYKCDKGYKPYVGEKGYKPYVCETCGLQLSSHSALQYHKIRHTGDKPHKCDVCGVMFSVKSSLINHQRKHTGETPYSCDDCGLKFSVITSLQNHQRKHTGENPYSCDICGMKFAFRGSLKDHKRLHTGEKPFKCALCFANFSNKRKLKRHKNVHTDENLYTSGGPSLDLS